MAQQMYCQKCRKTMAETNFYTLPNGSKCELCKSCLTMHFDAFKEDTFMWAIQKFDVPYVATEWAKVRDKEYKKCVDKVTLNGSKDPNKDAYSLFNSGTIFGKYLGKMKLSQWNKFHWADTELLKVKQEEEAKLHQDNLQTNEQLEEMREAYERGDIPESQYITYMSIQEDNTPNFNLVDGAIVSSNDSFPVNDNPFEKVDVPDVGADLTDEDKIMLAMKWGRLYTASDWVALEQLYNDYDRSFDLHNADLISGIKRVCKLDLKCNQALDSGDVDSYSKLERASDALRKSLKLTEAQRKEEKNSNLSCVGQIVAYCEMKKGYISKIDLSVDRDIVDRDIHDIKNYTRALIEEDPAVFKQIEEYIKKREILLEQEADAANPEFELTDKDMTAYNNSIEEQISEDYDEDEEDDE